MNDSTSLGIDPDFTMSMDTSNLHNSGKSADAGGKRGAAGGSITVDGRPDVTVIGASRHRARRAALFNGIDINAGKSEGVHFDVNTDSVMSDVEANALLGSLMAKLELYGDAYKFPFLEAICLSQAINSSSLQQPGRATFVVGQVVYNFHSDVLAHLGNDQRRFFRAFADHTREALERILRDYRNLATIPENRRESVSRMHDHVMNVARQKGLSRAPYLIHDTAEFCTGLTMTETHFIDASKANLLVGGNAVDNPVIYGSSGGGRVEGSVALKSHAKASPIATGVGGGGDVFAAFN
nr:capsid protein [Fusarium asiaticum vivivirus 1]